MKDVKCQYGLDSINNIAVTVLVAVWLDKQEFFNREKILRLSDFLPSCTHTHTHFTSPGNVISSDLDWT